MADLSKKNDGTMLDGSLTPNIAAGECGDEVPFKDERDSAYSWFILALLFMIKFFAMGSFVTYGLMFSETLKQPDLTREEVSWQFASITTVENLSSLFVSLSTFYLSWRKLEFIAAFLGVLANVGTFFSRSQLLDSILIGVVEGLSQAFTTVPIMAINNAFFKKYRSTAYGLLASGPYFGAIFLQLVVSKTMKKYGLKYGYLVLGAASSINLVLSLFIRKSRGAPSSDQRVASSANDHNNHDLHQEFGGHVVHITSNKIKLLRAIEVFVYLLKKPYFHLIWLTQLIFYWHYASMSLLIVDYGSDRGLDESHAGSLLTMYSVGALFGRFVPAFLLDLRILPVRYMASLAIFSISLALFLMTMTPMAMYWAYAVLVVILGVSISFVYVIINLLNVEYIGEELISVSFGLSAFIDGWFMLARPKVIGYFRDQLEDYNLMYQLMYTVCLLVSLGWILAPNIGKALKALGIFSGVNRSTTTTTKQQSGTK